MKKLVFLLAISGAAFTMNAQDKKAATPASQTTATQTAAPADGKAPQMKFTVTDLNYGEIKQGSDPNREFVFTNTGKSPLVISKAVGSCGCTVPTWPTEPILPGKKAAIKVRYDTQRVGAFTKTITLTTNAVGQESFQLTIHGNVKAEPAPATTTDKPVDSPAPAKH